MQAPIMHERRAVVAVVESIQRLRARHSQRARRPVHHRGIDGMI
jgi:hypothetical protein